MTTQADQEISDIVKNGGATSLQCSSTRPHFALTAGVCLCMCVWWVCVWCVCVVGVCVVCVCSVCTCVCGVHVCDHNCVHECL